jgi:predicted AlkP superfamily phosphohydrolase/phosphomutase
MDWSKTKAFAATPTSNGVFIVVNRDGKSPGIDPAEYASFRDRLACELRSVRHPDTSAPIVQDVFTKDQIFGETYADIAPDLTVTMMDGGLISILPSERMVSRRPSVSGVHHPIGIFAARGPGIRKGDAADTLSILDVAPIILHSLGLAVPEDMEGAVPPCLYEKPQDVLRKRSDVAAPGGDRELAAVTALSREDEEVVLARLRELGYTE